MALLLFISHRRLRYALHQNKGEGTEKIKDAFHVAVEHAFGKHDTCPADSWCAAKTDPGHNPSEGYRGKYLDVDDPQFRYDDVLKRVKLYMTPEKLDQMNHHYNTNASEAFHSKISVVAPKHTNYAQGQSFNTRVAIAVIETNEGIADAAKQVFGELGLESAHTDTVLGAIQESRETRLQHVLLPATKHARKVAKKARSVDGRNALRREGEKGGGKYESCIAFGLFDEGKQTCASCNKVGHLTSRAQSCDNYQFMPAGGGGGGSSAAAAAAAPKRKRKAAAAEPEYPDSGSDSDSDSYPESPDRDGDTEDTGEQAAAAPVRAYTCTLCSQRRSWPACRPLPRGDRVKGAEGAKFKCTYLSSLDLDCQTSEEMWNWVVSGQE